MSVAAVEPFRASAHDMNRQIWPIMDVFPNGPIAGVGDPHTPSAGNGAYLPFQTFKPGALDLCTQKGPFGTLTGALGRSRDEVADRQWP